MRQWLVATALACVSMAGAVTAASAGDAPPPWAYGFTTPVPPGTPPAEPNPQQALDDVTLHSLTGSKFSFTGAQIANRYSPADWFPEDHPAMPEIVAKGKVFAQPQVYACSLCHYPNGKGRALQGPAGGSRLLRTIAARHARPAHRCPAPARVRGRRHPRGHYSRAAFGRPAVKPGRWIYKS